MAAALCVEQGCEPRELHVRSLQEALLQDPIAPTAVIPLFNLSPQHPEWLAWQQYYLDNPENYPTNGYAPVAFGQPLIKKGQAKENRLIDNQTAPLQRVSGLFRVRGDQTYEVEIVDPVDIQGTTMKLVTLLAEVDETLKQLKNEELICVVGQINLAGRWLLAHQLQTSS
jgi:hypothetical protein